MIDAQLTIRAGAARKTVQLTDYLDAISEESAHAAAYRWIKALRHLSIDEQGFRDRFTARGDSLWWFTELYLHKQQVILDVHRAILAIKSVIEREQPSEIVAADPSPVVAHVIDGVAASIGVHCATRVKPVTWLKRLAAIDGRARALTLSALATRDRWRRAAPRSPATVGAFIHRAFWRSGQEDGGAESYVGPVLAALEASVGAGAVRYIGLGPSTNFRTHRRLRSQAHQAAAVVPVERFASAAALALSRGVWRQRYSDFRALTRSTELRRAACIEGIDCWPLVREELAGVAWLQWPWSVRAMDEAAAALDAVQPSVVVTYAEAGGWGRALVLEARRRGIPSAGLQHGFIYRHWLNYLHEPDEMQDGRTAGFPLPTRTLLFDEYAAEHLVAHGRYPREQLQVTGSPRLDELADEMFRWTATDLDRTRAALGVPPSHQIALVATKEREARASLPEFLDAASSIPDVLVIIKPHPAESAEAYAGYVRGRPAVRVADSRASLSQLLGLARVVVTVNSTVALDAGALRVPAMSIGLPNNLSPFVDAGAIAGTGDPAGMRPLLRRILYDEGFRQHLADRRRAVLGEPVTAHGRGAAKRSAEAVLELVARGGAGAKRSG
jgi:hypothetical protein